MIAFYSSYFVFIVILMYWSPHGHKINGYFEATYVVVSTLIFDCALLSQLFELHLLLKMVRFQNDIGENEVMCKRAEFH